MSLFKPYKHGETNNIGILFGRPGVGKTSLLTGLHTTELGKVVLVDLEDGKGKVVPEGVYATERVTDLRMLSRVHKELARERPDDANVLVFDSLTGLRQIALEHVSGEKGTPLDQVPKKNQKVWADTNVQVFRFVKAFIELGFRHLFFVAGEEVSGPDDGPHVIKPQLSEKLSDQIAHYVGNCFRLEVRANGTRRLHLAASATVQAKNRVPGLTDRFGKTIDLAKATEPQTKFIELLGEL